MRNIFCPYILILLLVPEHHEWALIIHYTFILLNNAYFFLTEKSSSCGFCPSETGKLKVNQNLQIFCKLYIHLPETSIHLVIYMPCTGICYPPSNTSFNNVKVALEKMNLPQPISWTWIVWIGISVGGDHTRCSIWPLRWWPYSSFMRNSPIWDFGKMSGIHSIINGVGSFWSGVVVPM